MYGATILGLISLVLTLAVPVLMVFITIWVFAIKKNSEIAVAQQKEIIELLKRP